MQHVCAVPLSMGRAVLCQAPMQTPEQTTQPGAPTQTPVQTTQLSLFRVVQECLQQLKGDLPHCPNQSGSAPHEDLLHTGSSQLQGIPDHGFLSLRASWQDLGRSQCRGLPSPAVLGLYCLAHAVRCSQGAGEMLLYNSPFPSSPAVLSTSSQLSAQSTQAGVPPPSQEGLEVA